MAGTIEGAIDRYKRSLEDLTFNSKPLIDDLTREAATLDQVGEQIIEVIQSRIMKVRPEWKLPSLYLMDSILKNLKGLYLEHISKVIVGVFCHCFEKLTEPEPRKSLYKLRTTWPPYVPSRKLAAIDRHVHALDPNWPIVAVDADIVDRPAIFVNPAFITGSARESVKATRSKSPAPITSAKPPSENKPANEEQKSIQDRRRILLEQKKSQRQEQQREMGLSPQSKVNSHPRSASPLTITESTKRSVSPKLTESTKRSVSPKLTESIPNTTAEPNTLLPEAKRVKMEIGSQQNARGPQETIKQSHLQLDDIPPELLPKHHENILKRIERQIDSGNLTQEQRATLVSQLNQLYELQKLKSNPSSTDSIEHHTTEQRKPPLHFNKESRDHVRGATVVNPRPHHGNNTWNRGPQGPLPPPPLNRQTTQAGGPPVPVEDLLNNLVKAGVIGPSVERYEEPNNPHRTIPNLSLTVGTLKQRYGSLIAFLHNGEPCSSCGLRFNPSGENYRAHLNWHYKINRQDKDISNPSSRNWFMHPDDWLQYEELEEVDSKEKNLEPPQEKSPVRLPPLEESREIKEESKSCPVQAGEDNEVCTVCQEPLEQFWEEEEEAWHYRDTIRINPGGKLYHTYCFKDDAT